MSRLPFALFFALSALPCLGCSGGNSGDAGPTLTCGAGTHAVDASCVADPLDAGPSQTCAPGTHLAFGACIRDALDAGPLPSDAGFTDRTTWTPNEQVGHDGTHATGDPQLAVDSHGTIYLAYMDVTAPGIGCCVYLVRSPATPHAFTEVTRVESTSTTVGYGAPTVLVDRMDRVYFGFVRYARGSGSRNTGSVMVTTSADGTTFSSPVEVGTHDPRYASNDRPWLTLAPDGSVHLSWSFATSDYRYPGVGVKYAQSTDGQTFGTEQVAFRPDATVTTFDRTPLGYDATGQLAVVTAPSQTTASGDTNYTLQGWHQDSGAWTASTIAPLLGERHYWFHAAPTLISDSHGVLTSVFLNAVSRDVAAYFTRSTDGRTWSMPAPVESDMLPAHTVAIPWATVDEGDHVHVAWLDNRYGAWVPYVSYASGGSFTPPERIGDATFVENGSLTGWIGDAMSLAVRGHQRYAAWTDTRSGMSQVYFSTSPSTL